MPALKGQGSANKGIQYVQDQRISVTKRSSNTIQEYSRYLWQIDKLDKIINVPEGGFDHAMDATRYALDTYNNQPTGTIFVPNNEL